MCNDVYWNQIFSRNRDSYLSFQFQHISPVFLQTDTAQCSSQQWGCRVCWPAGAWLTGSGVDLVIPIRQTWSGQFPYESISKVRGETLHIFMHGKLSPQAGWVRLCRQGRAAWQRLKWSRLRHATVIWSSEVTLMMPAFWRLAALLKCNPSLQDG